MNCSISHSKSLATTEIFKLPPKINHLLEEYFKHRQHIIDLRIEHGYLKITLNGSPKHIWCDFCDSYDCSCHF